MDSSPDLSLKLRRGSSDSRDNFYMDFAQGIDSDIEEVDNSALARDPQQPPTPPLPVLDDAIANMGAVVNAPLPPPMPLTGQPLPTVAETDDLPPTPPPDLSEHVPPASPPASPTSSVLEMMPPPPVSPPAQPLRRVVQSPSPPIETEDEGDDGDGDDDDDDDDDDDADEPNDGDEEDDGNGDDDDDDKSTPPPPLPPLPSNYSYVHHGGGHSGAGLPSDPETPPLTRSPSTSPSPPPTPPPCPRLSLTKMVSPPPPLKQQSVTPPSESDQSQPNSPPPLPQSGRNISASPPRSSELSRDLHLSSPPPEFGGGDENLAATVAAAMEATSLEIAQGILQAPPYQTPAEANRSFEDESTTITTPPSNGYSASSIIAPPAEHLAELDEDEDEQPGGMQLADIPPPIGMDDEDDEGPAEEPDERSASEQTSISEPRGDEAPPEEPPSEEAARVNLVDDARVPTPIASPPPPLPAATTLQRTGSTESGASKGPSRSMSRSNSRKTSRSGSVRGSCSGSGSGSGSSRAGSIASAVASMASGAQPVPAGVPSPPVSIKSTHSTPSVRSAQSLSRRSTPPSTSMKSPTQLVQQPGARVQSPTEGEDAPAMSSPPVIRTPPQLKTSPPLMHSPPKVTSPPKVYSPPKVSSPAVRQPEAEKFPKKVTDSLPTTSAVSSDSGSSAMGTVPAASAVAAAAAAISQQQGVAEQAAKPHPHSQLSGHHHYHLPHQFQHPHHQNHHPHTVAVAVPTVPATYVTSGRHVRMASGGFVGEREDDRTEVKSPTAAQSADESAKFVTARLRDSGSHHRVTIDESNLPVAASLVRQDVSSGGGPSGSGSSGGSGGSGGNAHDSNPPSPGTSSQQQLTGITIGGGDGGGDERQAGHLALMYHSHQLSNFPVLPAIKRTHRPSFIYPPMPRVRAGDALATLFSALYGKLLVVMGIAFPMAEVISTYIPPSFYEVYYLYLYIGSMIFLFFMYATLLWGRPKMPATIASPAKSTVKTRSTSATDSMDESDTDSSSPRPKHIPPVIPSARRPSLLAPLGRQHHYGSFYLRMGAVAFGIGSMIYSGLEFGQYFELNPDTKCHNVMLALTPATRMAFIFIQMYFIFLNNEQIKVYRYKIIARFGLMHMIGTNLAVWLNVLIQETKHEILTFYNPENRTLRISHRLPGHSRGHAILTPDPSAHLRVPRGLKGPYQIFECRRTNILGTLVQDASPFLFPCTIEYSLICAAILYVMWRSISRPQGPTPQRPDTISSPMKRSPHHYSVDCARAHKGLFVGILILVLTIISLILFFVLISRPDFVALAVFEVTICELLIYGTATIATLVGMFQIRHLQYDAYRSFSLDDILLVGAQTGSFLYNIFTVIAGHFSLRSNDMLVPINALASIVQTACQTMFILDASRRQAVSPEHIRKKPGREIVTFMLVVNLAMWAISTLEKSRAESHPIQLNFYGLWAWTIITHVSMPLAIFYRFHSTVCLCEIWKRAYKLKPAYM